MQPDDLQKLSRGELIELATSREVPSADTLTRAELVDEITGRDEEEEPPPGVLGLLGAAGELVAGMVDEKLHMPEAAKLIREMAKPRRTSRPPPPLPTVTLAEIYAAQGHLPKALTVLDEVLAAEPDHDDARNLRGRLAQELAAKQQVDGETTSADTEQAPDPVVTPDDDDISDEEGDMEVAPRASVDGDSETNDAADRRDEADSPAVAPAQNAAPLPSRYDVDEVVALATNPRTAYVYWELRPLRFARARHTDPEGTLVLRALTVRTGDFDVTSDSRDIPVEPLVGDRFISGLVPGAELRLCLGWNGPKGFVPLAIAEALQLPRDHAAQQPAPSATTRQNAPASAQPLDAGGAVVAHEAAGKVAAIASNRLNGYRARQPRLPHPAPTGAAETSTAPGTTDGPRVVNILEASPSVGESRLGGASDLVGGAELHGIAGSPGDLRSQLGGASDLQGGASDLYGGASDLHGGASDLHAEADDLSK